MLYWTYATKSPHRCISVRQGTHAVHTLGYYKKNFGFRDYDYPMCDIANRLSITLPLYCGMTEEEQHCKTRANALKQLQFFDASLR